MECPPIQEKWSFTFEFPLCTDTLQGFLGIWIAALIQIFGQFLVSITASVLMLYFDEHWELEKQMEEKVQHIREDNQTLLSGESYSESDTEGTDTENNNVKL